MKPFALSLSLLLAFCLSLHCLTPTSTADDEAKKLSAELEAAKKKLTEVRVTLQYKFAKGETLHWKVEHLGATETTIQGNTQTSESRSVSTKVWQITGVDSKGNMTVTHSVANVDMWQKLSDRPEIRFNSKTDKTAPPEYENVAKTIGVPLTTLTFASDGTIVKRGISLRQANPRLAKSVAAGMNLPRFASDKRTAGRRPSRHASNTH